MHVGAETPGGEAEQAAARSDVEEPHARPALATEHLAERRSGLLDPLVVDTARKRAQFLPNSNRSPRATSSACAVGGQDAASSARPGMLVSVIGSKPGTQGGREGRRRGAAGPGITAAASQPSRACAGGGGRSPRSAPRPPAMKSPAKNARLPSWRRSSAQILPCAAPRQVPAEPASSAARARSCRARARCAGTSRRRWRTDSPRRRRLRDERTAVVADAAAAAWTTRSHMSKSSELRSDSSKRPAGDEHVAPRQHRHHHVALLGDERFDGHRPGRRVDVHEEPAGAKRIAEGRRIRIHDGQIVPARARRAACPR